MYKFRIVRNFGYGKVFSVEHKRKGLAGIWDVWGGIGEYDSLEDAKHRVFQELTLLKELKKYKVMDSLPHITEKK